MDRSNFILSFAIFKYVVNNWWSVVVVVVTYLPTCHRACPHPSRKINSMAEGRRRRRASSEDLMWYMAVYISCCLLSFASFCILHFYICTYLIFENDIVHGRDGDDGRCSIGQHQTWTNKQVHEQYNNLMKMYMKYRWTDEHTWKEVHIWKSSISVHLFLVFAPDLIFLFGISWHLVHLWKAYRKGKYIRRRTCRLFWLKSVHGRWLDARCSSCCQLVVHESSRQVHEWI